jgi:hypothetical protein
MLFIYLFIGSTGAWTQDLVLEQTFPIAGLGTII